MKGQQSLKDLDNFYKSITKVDCSIINCRERYLVYLIHLMNNNSEINIYSEVEEIFYNEFFVSQVSPELIYIFLDHLEEFLESPTSKFVFFIRSEKVNSLKSVNININFLDIVTSGIYKSKIIVRKFVEDLVCVKYISRFINSENLVYLQNEPYKFFGSALLIPKFKEDHLKQLIDYSKIIKL